jgi:hypothetical protein
MNIEIFEQYVRDHELKTQVELYKDKEEAKHRALGCGCPSCQKVAISAEERFQDEAERVYGSNYPVDHEEEFVTNQALKILYQRKPDLLEGNE